MSKRISDYFNKLEKKIKLNKEDEIFNDFSSIQNNFRINELSGAWLLQNECPNKQYVTKNRNFVLLPYKYIMESAKQFLTSDSSLIDNPFTKFNSGIFHKLLYFHKTTNLVNSIDSSVTVSLPNSLKSFSWCNIPENICFVLNYSPSCYIYNIETKISSQSVTISSNINSVTAVNNNLLIHSDKYLYFYDINNTNKAAWLLPSSNQFEQRAQFQPEVSFYNYSTPYLWIGNSTGEILVYDTRILKTTAFSLSKSPLYLAKYSLSSLYPKLTTELRIVNIHFINPTNVLVFTKCGWIFLFELTNMLCLVNHYTPDLLSDYVDMRAYNFNTFSSVVSNDAILQINNVNKNKYNIIDYSRSQNNSSNMDSINNIQLNFEPLSIDIHPSVPLLCFSNQNFFKLAEF